MHDCKITIACGLGRDSSEKPVEGVHLLSPTLFPFLPYPTFDLLTYIRIDLVPLRLVAGPSYQVWTDNHATEDFFSRVILAGAPDGFGKKELPFWWKDPGGQSPLGILVRAPSQKREDWNHVRITELLFYGTVEGEELRVRALPLSSDLLCCTIDGPPPSRRPSYDGDVEAQFLPSPELPTPPSELTGEPDVSPKRKKIDDVFDLAVERRRKARTSGGEGIATAAAGAGVNGHRRSISLEPKAAIPDSRRPLSLDQKPIKHDSEARDFYSQASTLPSRPHSRASSISSDARPLSRKGPTEQTKRSSLFRVTSAAEAEQEDSIETKNKEAITRLVMAGMRLYGMQQSKTSRTRRNSLAPSAAESVGDGSIVTTEIAAKDEEYKLVYHQAYRGTCVAFRNHINTEPLYLHPNRLQDTVDKLLAILCNDPLVHPLSESRATEIAITPSGRPEKHGAFNPAFSTSRDAESSLELPGSQLEVRRSPLASRGAGPG